MCGRGDPASDRLRWQRRLLAECQYHHQEEGREHELERLGERPEDRGQDRLLNRIRPPIARNEVLEIGRVLDRERFVESEGNHARLDRPGSPGLGPRRARVWHGGMREEEGDCDNAEEDGHELEQALPDENNQIAAVSTQRQSILEIAIHALFLPAPTAGIMPAQFLRIRAARLVVVTWEAA